VLIAKSEKEKYNNCIIHQKESQGGILMKVVRIGAPETVMSHSGSVYNYFGWPTAKRLQDGRIAVGASGFRKRHVCPYGKAVVSYSSDGGRSYTPPIPVIDTSLDDRDCGIATFGESGMIVTSFNNTVAFQMQFADAEEYQNRQQELLRLIADSDGSDNVVIYLKNTKNVKILPPNLQVNADEEIKNRLKVAFGEENVKFVTKPIENR
jgi:hypothetical protein